MRKDTVISWLCSCLLVQVVGGHASAECDIPPETGDCRSRQISFYYDSDYQRCGFFFYGGCGGNGNRFESLQACHDACHQPNAYDDQDVSSLKVHVKSDHCYMPPVEDNDRMCRGAFPKFTFNANTGECSSILYGGCGGTRNLYSSLDECLSACVNGPYVSAEPEEDVQVRFRFFVEEEEEDEEEESSAIIFPGFNEEEDICKLPPMEPGPIACLAYIEKWTYDLRQQECVKFYYGGCRGTKNLFDSKSACEERCSKNAKKIQAIEESETPALCLQPPTNPPPDQGFISCRAYFPMFTFNAESGKCEPFIYGGCFGTDNLFVTEEDCYQACSPANAPPTKTIDVCGLPIKSGPCRAALRKYGFNGKTRRCELFYYGGCEGNENQFSSIQDCVDTCGGVEPLENPICSATDCNNEESRLYKAKGCQPIIKPGECCASSWSCDNWKERLSKPDKCYFANERYPNGKYYEIGQPMPEISLNCNVNCVCGPMDLGGVAKPICAAVDCPGFPSGKNCKKVYQSLEGCCDFSFKCEEELEGLFACDYENSTYVEGEKMYSDIEPCRVCQCREGWNGRDSDEFCTNVDCFATYGHYLAMNCQPVFKDGVCCPIDWECPTEDDDIASSPRFEIPQLPTECPPGSQPLEAASDQDFVVPLLEPLSTGVSSRKKEKFSGEQSDICLLSRPNGECTGYAEKWYFDISSRKCEKFLYGSEISKGRNVFDSQEKCSDICGKYFLDTDENLEQSCEHVSEENRDPNLHGIVDRCTPLNAFRFNKDTRQCEDFTFLGCRKNRNSFATIDACEAVCANEVRPTQPGLSGKCGLEVQIGDCRSRMQRFYYDPQSGLCKQFWYSGCGGNSNNFNDLRDCIKSCVPTERIPRAVQGQKLELKDPCEQPVKGGPCRGAKPMWYFDKGTSTCKMFLYGGCQGNENRFSTFSQCSQTCPIDADAQKKLRDACSLPLSPGGFCRARQPRYYYDSETNDCELFFYSGCDGNANNFATRSQCRLSCKFALRESSEDSSRQSAERGVDDEQQIALIPVAASLQTDVCFLDKEIGLCRGAFKKYYFDRDEKKCKSFLYGGCMGNANNFGSLDECTLACGMHSEQVEVDINNVVAVNDPVCSDPMDAGPCKAYRPYWFFNSTSGACERFYWGGCRGNQNRFRSEDDCQSTCGVSKLESETVALPPAPPKCRQGKKEFNLGDVIRFNEDKCRVCTCNAPPDLTCKIKSCPKLPPKPANSGRCFKKYDSDGCCVIAFRCLPAASPRALIREECQNKQCRSIKLSPAKVGQVCTKIYSSDGCCLIGQNCEPQECTSKVCNPVLLTPARSGEECTRTYDRENCCVIGQLCSPKLCNRQQCRQVRLAPPREGETCNPKLDENNCCVTGQTCYKDICAKRACTLQAFLPPPGQVCQEEKDPDGCCVIGLKNCIPAKCVGKPCPLIGFLPEDGKTCRERRDPDGCCVVGLDCE